MPRRFAAIKKSWWKRRLIQHCQDVEGGKAVESAMTLVFTKGSYQVNHFHVARPFVSAKAAIVVLLSFAIFFGTFFVAEILCFGESRSRRHLRRARLRLTRWDFVPSARKGYACNLIWQHRFSRYCHIVLAELKGLHWFGGIWLHWTASMLKWGACFGFLSDIDSRKARLHRDRLFNYKVKCILRKKMVAFTHRKRDCIRRLS